MKLLKNLSVLTCTLLMCGTVAHAQVSTNPNKFLGNITTRGSVEAGGGVPSYYKLWNQITCENESKWSSVEGSRGNFNWGGANNAFNYAKQHNFTYKYHALVWGAQYPSWLESLSARERFAALTNWFDHAKAQYNTLPMIDVVNEAVGMHQQGNPMMKETLGGGGKTGYDWLIKAFEMAYERWPDAILIYNDYNSIRYDLNNYIDLVKTLRNAGAPIDAYGNQSHEVSDISESELKNNLKTQQDALKMPMFITELDIDVANDAQQKSQYQKVLPAMWELPYCAGVTLWGYVLGATWVSNSGLYRGAEERPAMEWIREYMATDAARNAVGPFPGTKKEASIYIRPAALKVAQDDVLPIKIRARLATKTIAKVDFYVNDELVETMTEEPYIVNYTASKTGDCTTKAVVTATDGSTYERYGYFKVQKGAKRSPYNDVVPQLPGTIDVTAYDNGMSGVSYYNATRSLTSATKNGQWMEYTVDVQEDGYYTMDVEVASTKAGGMFHLAEYTLDNLLYLTEFTDVPNTGGTTAYQAVRCPIKEYLKAGRHVFTLLIDKGGFFIKSMTLKSVPTFTVPGTVEAEDYCTGGDGMDVVSGNGGYVLSNANSNKWAEYSINVTQAGKYDYEFTASSAVADTRVNISLVNSDGSLENLLTVSLPNTGSKDTYQVKTGKIRKGIKNEGLQRLRLTITSGDCNIDNVKFICTDPTGISTVVDDNEFDGPVYNLQGLPVGDDYRGIVIINGKKVVRK